MRKEIKFFLIGFALTLAVLFAIYLAITVASNLGSETSPAQTAQGAVAGQTNTRQPIPEGPDDLNKARIMAHNGDYAAAIKMCDGLISGGKDVDTTLIFQAELYNQAKDYKKAIANCQLAIKKSPNNTWALRTLGETFRLQKDYSEAKKYFDNTIKLDTSKEQTDAACAYFGLGNIDKENGNIKGAKKNMETALRLMPGSIFFKEALAQLK